MSMGSLEKNERQTKKRMRDAARKVRRVKARRVMQAFRALGSSVAKG
jgi:type III secretory pathway component EscU